MVERGGESALEAIGRAAGVLRAASVPNPRLDADVLLAAALGTSREGLYRELLREVPPEAGRRFDEMVARRARRCPVPYILGEREFWSLTFRVDPRVLIPRHETELIVETALGHAPEGAALDVADVGAGSGCIALAFASERPRCRVIAADASPDALDVARANIHALGLGERVRTVQADILPLEGGRFHLVLSNPPYVSEAEWDGLMPEVRCHEPRQALVAGPTGLEFYPGLAARAREALLGGGLLVVEVGAGQAGQVETILEAHGLTVVEVVSDFAGIPRVVAARRTG